MNTLMGQAKFTNPNLKGAHNMCKVIGFSNFSKIKTPKTGIERIGNILLKIEKDGFGYAVQGESGVFGEKTVASEFQTRLNAKSLVKLPIFTPKSDIFGAYSKPIGPAIFHGRTSTNVSDLANCHPMQRESWNLIHNGVVTDHGPKYQKNTANDSEDVLHRLISGGIDHVAEYLSGYYAFLAIDPNGQLHVARDKTARLVVAWSDQIQSYVFATTPELIQKTAKALNFKVGPIEYVLDDLYMVFQNNELVSLTNFKSRGYSGRESRHASKSLGYSLVDESTTRYSETRYSEAYESWPSFADSGGTEIDTSDEKAIRDIETELECMDASYRIWDYHGNSLTVEQFHKLDFVAQLECQIQRGDGTMVELDLLEQIA